MTLQFKWIQLQYPVVSLAFERLLFAATPPVAAMILAWGTLTAVGPSHAPFYQAAVLSGEAVHRGCIHVSLLTLEGST